MLVSTVADLSALASWSGSGPSYTVATPSSAGFSSSRSPIRWPAPRPSDPRVADGRVMHPANAWLSATQDRTTQQWSHFVNVFDVNNTAGLAYTIQHEEPPSLTNRPPRLDALSDWNLSAGNYISFVVTANDPDDDVLTYSLDSPPPAGATLHPAIGQFSWCPAPNQAPSTNVFRVRVTDKGSPNLGDTRTFTIAVKNNTAPTLAAIPDCFTAVLLPVSFTNSASDADGGLTLLTYALEPGAPEGARIGPTSGVFYWMRKREQAPSTNVITVKVSANGLPALSGRKTFTVVVRLHFLELTVGGFVQHSQQLAQLQFTAVVGRHSGFLQVAPTEALGLAADGLAIPLTLLNGDTITYIGLESLLKTVHGENGTGYMVVYGHPGTNYVLERTTDIGITNS